MISKEQLRKNYIKYLVMVVAIALGWMAIAMLYTGGVQVMLALLFGTAWGWFCASAMHW